MKKISILFLISFLSIIIISCNKNTIENSKEINQNITIETNTIEFNNGEKWNVDSNMIIHIRKMENEIKIFPKTELKDYNLLSKKLQKNIDILTSNCTMKGKAHDELHKWLLPYIDLVSELSEAKENTKAEKIFNEVEHSFVTFNQYFK